MSNRNPTPEDPTANWRKYPKSPNFLGIVIGSSVAIIVLLFAAWLLLGRDARKMIPHGPNPQPNSRLFRPLDPAPTRSLA
jgi:hypothetical protein